MSLASKAAALRPSAFVRAIRENPVLVRQVAVHLGGTRFAFAFLFLNAALLIASLSTVLAGINDRSRAGPSPALGAMLEPVYCMVTFGILAFLLPLRVAGMFEGARMDHVFDQIVVTGVPPGKLHVGNWLQAMAYAAVLLIATLPYHAFAFACQGVAVSGIARDLALLYLHAGVIVIVAQALSVSVTEFIAPFAAQLMFLILGALAFAPMPSAVMHWTPMRFFLQEHLESWMVPGQARLFYGPPVIFNFQVPDGLVMGIEWSLLAGAAFVYLALGPVHEFIPGLNNFGNVVMPGDRKRSRFRTLRFHLTRRVEMAFLYENRSPRWAAWDWMLRVGVIFAFTFLWWTTMIGFCFSPSAGLSGGPYALGQGQIACLSLGGVGLAFALLAYGESRERIYTKEKVGPFLLPRGVLSFVYFAAALAGFTAFTAVPLTAWMRDSSATRWSADPGLQQQLADHLARLPERIGALLLFAFVVYLLGRVIARGVTGARSGRGLLLLATILLLFIPLFLFPLFVENLISPAVARAGFTSPLAYLWASFDEGDRTFGNLGNVKKLYWVIQGSLAGVLVLWLLALNVRRRAIRGRAAGAASGGAPAGRGPAGTAAGAALLAACVCCSAGASEITADVVRGFGRHSYSSFEHFTIVLSTVEGRGRSGPERAELWLETLEGSPYMASRQVEVPPGTRLLVRFAIPPEEMNQGPNTPLRLVVRSRGADRAFDVPESRIEDDSAVRFLVVSEGGKTPPLVPSGHHWVGCAPDWLPETPEAYLGADFVLAGGDTLANWSPAQLRALYDFARGGGTVIFFGPVDERAVQASLEWKPLLEASETPRGPGGALPLTLHVLRDSRVVWREGKGEESLSLLSLKSVGPGIIGHLSVNPLEAATPAALGGPELFWRRFIRRTPSSIGGSIPFLLPENLWASRSGGSLLAVGIYFAAYALLLGPAMFFLFRNRRRRIWGWVYAPAISLLFVLGSPVLFLLMEGNPSGGHAVNVTFHGLHGGEAVRCTGLSVYSSGRQRHRLSFTGENVTAFAALHILEGAPFGSRQIVPLGAVAGPGSLDVNDFRIMPWGRRYAFALSREAESTSSVRGKVTADRRTGKWSYEVSGLKPEAAAQILLMESKELADAQGAQASRQYAGRPFLVESITKIGPDERAKGTLDPGQNWNIPTLKNYQFHVALSPLARPRAFVLFAQAEEKSGVESDDIMLNPEARKYGIQVQEIEVIIPGAVEEGESEER